ncbi:MAG: DUF6305 family protein [Bacillota bacterium]
MKLAGKYMYMGIIACTIILIIGCNSNTDNLSYTLPHLPYPIAKERVLITVAGQGPEGLVVAKVCDDLKIRNVYNYKANVEDLEGRNSLLIVVGVSKTGMESIHTDFTKEKERVEKLAAKAAEQRIPLIVLYLGGQNRWDEQSQQLLTKIGKYANYMIAISSLEGEEFFRELASIKNMPYTLVRDLERFNIPLNSVFR